MLVKAIEVTTNESNDPNKAKLKVKFKGGKRVLLFCSNMNFVQNAPSFSYGFV